MHISLSAETVTHFLGLPITNTLIASWLVTVVLAIIAYLATRNLKPVPGKLQNVLEMAVESLYNMVHDITNNKKHTEMFFPVVATIFLFVILSNWMGLLPGFTTIGFHEQKEGHSVLVSFLRSANSDLNTTLALAIISVVATQVFGVAALGFLTYTKKFLNFSSPIALFIGLLEIISETAKVISFSFRLFGNVFAGEILLTVIMTIIPFIAPVPFFALELFVGFIQALVFAMLTVVFMNGAVTAHTEH